MTSARRFVPWWVAGLYTCALGPFFFLVYGSVNNFTATRHDVGTFYWEWERLIPFIPAMVIPYWTLDAFYAGSTFLCRSREELNHLARRMVFAIVAACACFLIVPLRFAFERPPVDGVYGLLFAALSLDKPFNLAPSLHITLRSIVWVPYGRVLTGAPRTLLWVWFFVIGISTLFTYQHHFVDLLAGEVLTVFVFYLVPEHHSWPKLREWKPLRWRLVRIYGCLGAAFLAVALLIRGWGLLLLWPALSLGMVACAYAGAGHAIFQKRHGRLSWPAATLLAPYLIGARIWLRMNAADPYCEVAPNLWLGRLLRGNEQAPLFTAILDLTAEHYEARPFRSLVYKNIALVDLTVPTLSQLREAVEFLQEHTRRGPVYVHCALGISRSCGVAAAYLLATGQAASVDAAVSQVQSVRPRAILPPRWLALLSEFQATAVHAQGAAR